MHRRPLGALVDQFDKTIPLTDYPALQLAQSLRSIQSAAQSLPRVAVMTSVIAVIAGRAAAVYPVCALFIRGPNRVGAAQQHALVWGGLRGALGLALVLSIPESYPWRNPIVVVTFGVVAFSIIVQGLTCRPLLRRACRTDSP
jgi:NhaP-type Na+/H+ or K+/H+ antiporter